MPDRSSPDADALVEWLALSEALLRGLVHALNNRLTALAAFGELTIQGDAEFSADRVLPGELDRLQALSALLRLLVRDEGPLEALELRAVADDALALQAHHADARAISCRVEYEGGPAAVRAPRWAVLRLLLALLEAGRRAAEGAGRDEVLLRITSDDESIVLRLDTNGVAAMSRYAAVMAGACGAAPPSGAPSEIRLPTLQALRRRERTSGEAAGA